MVKNINLKNLIVEDLIKMREEYEKKDDSTLEEMILTAFKKIVAKHKIVGISNVYLKDASYTSKKYKEAIVILKSQNKLTEVSYGQSNVYYLTEIISDAAEKFKEYLK